MRARAAVIIVALLAVTGLAACGSDTASTTTGSSGTAAPSGGTVPGTTPPSGLAGTSWLLTAHDGPNGTSVPAAPASSAMLAFGPDGALNGSTGCNQFSGTYTESGSDLTIELGPTTRAACASPVLTVQETAILQLLPETATYDHADGLTLNDADGSELLTYEAGLAGLTDTSWTVTGVNNGSGAVEANALTENLTATFGPDGAFSGNGGCNQLSATYETTGSDGLTITGVTKTMMACEPAVDTLEAQYVAALEQVTTYTISGDALTLRNADGTTQVTLQLET